MMPNDRPRFLSEAACHQLVDRVARFTQGGGYTVVGINSKWTGNVRWARNQVSTSGEVEEDTVAIGRSINGAGNRMVVVNDTDDDTLIAAVRRAERLAAMSAEQPQSDLVSQLPLETSTTPHLFSNDTYNLDAARRAEAAHQLVQSSIEAGMLSAGYIEVSAHSQALIDTLGRSRYFQYTAAQYSVTVRDPNGTGSGWAGVDWHDWNRIDAAGISKTALQKCLSSRNPVRVEPGRYTTILEPQAVCDLISFMIGAMDRDVNESVSPPGPFTKSRPGTTGIIYSHIGDKIVDERITITSDPMDPDAGFPPFFFGYGTDGRGDAFDQPVYHPAVWIKDGVLQNLSYFRDYGIHSLGKDTGLQTSGGFRMSGGTTSIDDMITSTKRGVLVTRFDRILQLDQRLLLFTGYTRDGLWFIENGKISHPIKNFAFTESIFFVLNNVEQLGAPQRVFHPGYPFSSFPQPVIVPPLKVRDFSFTALSDAV